jgi:hypothetical protein
MSHSDIQSLKAQDLSAEELRLQKAQQAIDDLLMAANSDEFDDDELSEQELELVAGGRLGPPLDITASQGGTPSPVPNPVPNLPPARFPWW